MIKVSNKNAKRHIEVKKTFTAGLSLTGIEVKSIKNGQVHLDGSTVLISNREAFLINLNIPPYQAKNAPVEYNPKRNKRLLLTKKEIDSLRVLSCEKKLTLIPISIYNKGRYLKIDIGVGPKKKHHNKKEFLRERDIDREIKSAP